jgi:hypothetical protein
LRENIIPRDFIQFHSTDLREYVSVEVPATALYRRASLFKVGEVKIAQLLNCIGAP